MKTFYKVSCVYKIHLNEKPVSHECIERSTDKVIDNDGTLLEKAGKRFYDELFGEVGDAFEFGAKEDPKTDLLYRECWYEDPEYTKLAAVFSISENEIIRYLTAEKFGSDHVINGERCSTRTAALIGEWLDEWRWSDIYRTRERLYRKSTGHFFIEETNQQYMNRPMWENSKYRWLTTEEAKEWVKAHAADVYQELFGEIKYEDGTVLISALVRKDTKAKMDRIKAETGKTIGNIIDDAVDVAYKAKN